MGEKSYRVGSKLIAFSEDCEEFSCLCTFPHNNGFNFGLETIKSLALFGAVVQLVFKGYYDNHQEEYIFIPRDVPEYVLENIRQIEFPAIFDE